MTFILDFIHDAQGDAPLSGLLRKMKVLGVFTSTVQLTKWANQEINGYLPNADLPTYRGPFPSVITGHFVNQYGAQAKGLPIPAHTFPEDYREGPLFHMSFGQKVAELESFVNNKTSDWCWPADAVSAYNFMVSNGDIRRITTPDLFLVTTNMHIDVAVFIGILDTIRNKALDLALEVYSAAPEAGQPDASPDVKQSAQQVIIQFINQDVDLSHANLSAGNNSFGSSNVEQTMALKSDVRPYVQPPTTGKP